MNISYGVSGIVPRSRSRVRSISAMVSLRRPPVVRRLLQLMKATAAVDAGGGEEIGLDRHEDRGLLWVVVEVLHHDAIALAREIDHVARLPRMLDAIEHGVAAALDDEEDLPALEFQPAGATAGRDLLPVDRECGEHRVGNRRVQVPAHQALLVALKWQFGEPHDLHGALALFALAVAQRDQLVPEIVFGQLGGTLARHCEGLLTNMPADRSGCSARRSVLDGRPRMPRKTRSQIVRWNAFTNGCWGARGRETAPARSPWSPDCPSGR